jgi:hypothetical protein
MNPYQPPSDDESQLDRIERKHRIEGSYLLTLLIGGAFTALVFLMVEILGKWKF